MGETRIWMNFVTWLSVFYTSTAFRQSQVEGIRTIGQERRYGAANACDVASKTFQLRSRELGVENAHLQFPHTRPNRSLNPVPVQAPYVWRPSRSIVYGVWMRAKQTYFLNDGCEVRVEPKLLL
jgi:hypothetical protein